MEISRRAWDSYIRRLAAVNMQAADLMRDWLEANGYADMGGLLRYADSLVVKYGEAAGALASEMYDAVAELSGVHVPEAIPAAPAAPEEVEDAVRKAVERAPVTVPAEVGRLVKQTAADTTLQNALRDGAEFAWVPNGDTCAFCLMLASNGWQRASKKAIRNGHATHIHANCNCEYAVRFGEDTRIAGYDPAWYLEQYEKADGVKWQDKVNALRREAYEEQKDKINEQKRIRYAARQKEKSK